jgi:hypothetical protein
MITQKQVHDAIDDGLIDAIKQRAMMGSIAGLSEPIADVGAHFYEGLVVLKQAAVAQHAVVDKLFPE